MSDGAVQGLADDDRTETNGPVSLDPFAYLPGVASKIAGLGGTAPGHDNSYVFHTNYVAVGRGQATFTIRFAGLKCKRGTLFISVHMLPTEAGAQVRLVTSERLVMNRLVARDGETTIRFEGFDDALYAVLGSVPDTTDAQADALTVTLDVSDEEAEYDGPPIEARNTAYGSNALQLRSHLISLERPKLASPVSQACTAAQFAEPAYAEWARSLHLGSKRSRREWTFAYILQVLRQYGMLQSGAHALGFGVRDEPIPALLAASGISVVATQDGNSRDGPPHENAGLLDRLRAPHIVDDAVFGQQVAFRWADPAAIPRDLVNFDFVWSSDAGSRLGSASAGRKFLRDSLRCLRPGGLAVHVVDFDLRCRGDKVETPAMTMLQRNDIEQVAIDLISRGHEVAQIKIGTGQATWSNHIDMLADTTALAQSGAADVPGTAFGVVFRRAPGL